MKHYLLFLIFSLVFCLNLPAKADYIATETFVVNVSNTVTVVVSGTLSSPIDSSSGNLGNALNINFNIATNEDLENIHLKALVTDSNSIKQSAFAATDASEVSSKNINLVFGSNVESPTLAAINDCKLVTSTPANNPCAIAYPGTISINNNGQLSYSTSNGYFSCAVRSGTSDLHMALTTTAKAGTFDSVSSLDEAGLYLVEIFLDNIP